MSVTVSMVEASNPDGLTAAAAQVGATIGELDTVIATQRQALDRLRLAWQGAAGEAAIVKAEQNLTTQLQLQFRLEAVQKALGTGGAHLGATRDGLMDVVGTLGATGWTITDDGRAIAPERSGRRSAAPLRPRRRAPHCPRHRRPVRPPNRSASGGPPCAPPTSSG